MIAVITFKADPSKKYEVLPSGKLPSGEPACFGENKEGWCSLMKNGRLCTASYDMCETGVIFKEKP